MGDAFTITNPFFTEKGAERIKELQKEIAENVKKYKDSGKAKHKEAYEAAHKELASIYSEINNANGILNNNTTTNKLVAIKNDEPYTAMYYGFTPMTSIDTFEKAATINPVATGDKLTRSERRELNKLADKIKDIQKQIKKENKIDLSKVADDLVKQGENRAEAEYRLQTIKDNTLNNLYKELEKAEQKYHAQAAKYGVPSNAEILVAILGTETQEQLDAIKEELKAKKMTEVDVTKDFVKGSVYKNNVNVQERVIKSNNSVTYGAGLSDETLRQAEKRGLGANDETIHKLKVLSGTDHHFEKNAHEKEAALDYFNYKAVVLDPAIEGQEVFENDFFNKNRNKTFADIYPNSETVAELETNKLITRSAIKSVTLLTGENVDARAIDNIKLNEVLKINYGGPTDVINSKPTRVNVNDVDYMSEKQIKELAEAMGFDWEKKVDMVKALKDSAPVALATGIATAFPVARIHDLFTIDIQTGGGIMFKEFMNEWKKLVDKGWTMEENTAEALKGYKEVNIKGYGFSIAAAAIAADIIDNMLKQYFDKGTELADYNTYKQIFDKYTAEGIANIAGGLGGALGPEEADRILAEIAKIGELMAKDAEAKLKKGPAQTQKTEDVKIAQIEETKDTKTSEIAPCIYENKSGEYWEGIVSNTYFDQNGNQIKDYADIRALARHIKTVKNGYKLSDKHMPKGVRMLDQGESFTAPSGKVYTYGFCGAEDMSKVKRTIYQKKDGDGTENINFGAAADRTPITETTTIYTVSAHDATTGDNEKETKTFTNETDKNVYVKQLETDYLNGGYKKVNIFGAQ